jgi:hypothetical protein
MRFALGLDRGASPPSARCDLLEIRSTLSNGVSRNISPGLAAVKRGESDFPEQNRCSTGVTEVDAIRGYVEALGGTVDVVARVGDWTVRVA